MSKSAFELRYDLLALSYDLLSAGGKNNPRPSEIIAAAKEFNEFVSNSDRKVISVDVGGMSAEEASEAISAIKRGIQEKPEGKRKLFEEGEGGNFAEFAHKLDDFAHQAVGLALRSDGHCLDNKPGCNGGADTCDCNK